MVLKETYEKAEIHAAWESAFRSHPLERKLNDDIMRRLLSLLHPPPHALFLDAGCGVGDHTFRLAAQGYRCIGIDISEHVLRMARQNSSAKGCTRNTEFVCQAIEDLSFADNVFDVIHCRGVLMHIPDWEKALASLCRVLKPGGRIAILESNHRAVEMWVVKLVRALIRRETRQVATAGGLEFWSEEDGAPFVVRFADQAHLSRRMQAHSVAPVKRFATSFWDPNRFPEGGLRTAVIGFNRLYFRLHFPGALAIGNALIGEKKFLPVTHPLA